MFAQAAAARFGVGDDEVAGRVAASYERAARNPRGMRHAVRSVDEIRASAFEATPLREGHRAPLTDGAVFMVLASEAWLRRNPGRRPLARVAGVGWATDSYRLGEERLQAMNSARVAWTTALRQAGVTDAGAIDVVEIEAQTGYHEAAFVRAFELPDRVAVSPSGGPFARNPLFCTGLVGAAEAVLQVGGRAGPVQVAGVNRAAAHCCHGYAQQGNVVMVFEAVGADLA